jgi:diguanylate cyclase (GGDEF)-like protein
LSLTTADLSADERRTHEREPISPGGRLSELLALYRTRGGRRFAAEVSETQLDYRGHAATLTVVRDVTAQRQLEAKLWDSARHDLLTGLANRRLFIERFDQAQASRVRHDDGLAMISIDMDGFKTVNDRHGHGIGDDVLRVVAQRIRSLVRAQDTVARFGGDEFVLLIDGATAVTVGALAQRLVTWLAHPYDVLDTTLDISASLGIALIAPMTGVDEAVRASDIAMFAAKESGRQSYRMYDAHMRSAILERNATARELQQALDHGEFNLWYQPIVSWDDHHWAVNHVEALIRWNHPERGIVSPAEFIPIAEQTGSIVAIGTWVLRAGCAQIAEWQRSDRRVGLHVNVSGRQVKQPDFVALVMRIVAESGIDASDLILELTETALLEDLKGAQKPLNELRAMGIRIALDDFGSGYSSLTYLSQLPVDIVKIDRSFVANLGEPDRLSTLATIMRLMANLQVTVIAEGVETADELGHVLGLGVDAIQGYYFSRPVPAPELADVIERCEQIAAPDPTGLDRREPSAHQRSRGGGIKVVHAEPTVRA